MANGSQMMLEECVQMTFLDQIVGASDFPAKTSASVENNLDLKETAQASFTELCTFLGKSQKKKNPMSYSLRMLKICLVLIEDGISPNFSLNWTGGGYDAEWKIFNSKNYGVPQSRERCFIIGHRRGQSATEVFSDGSTDGENNSLTIMQVGRAKSDKRDNPQRSRVYDPRGLSPCLNTMQGGNLEPHIITEQGVRKLTPKECFRLQGWSDDYFEKAQFVNSDSQLYKQSGNGVTVSVVHEIAKRLKE